MNRFCCDHLCNQGRNCPLEFKDTVPDSEWLTRWMAENSEPVRYQMQMAIPEQIAELQRQSMNAAWNTNGDASFNAWSLCERAMADDFADTEPAAPPGSEGRGIVLAALIGVVVLIILGVWHAYF